MKNENRLKPVSPAGIKLRKCKTKILQSGEKKQYYKKMQLYIYSCSCGKFCTKVKYDVDSGNTKSCGCLNRELRIKQLNKLRRENSVLTKRVRELSKELKQYSALKDNILKLQTV